MKSAVSSYLIISVVGSALPVTAETRTGPIARIITREAVRLSVTEQAVTRLTQQSLPSADADTWETVRALRPETRVRVWLTDGSKIPGSVVEARPDALVLDKIQTGPAGIALPATASRRGLTFPRTEISDVDVLELPSRFKGLRVAYSFNELRAIVEPGDVVWVTTTAGTELKGTIKDLSKSSLLLSGDNRQSILRDDVARVQLKTGVGQGVLIGLGAGIGAALLIGLADKGSEVNAGAVLFLPLAGGGAGIGAAVAAATSRGPIIYMKPRTTQATPVFAP